MEIQFLHESFTEKDPKLLMEHIQRMASGEATLYAATLSLVYDKLVERAFARPIPSGSGPRKHTEVQNVVSPCPPLQASTSISVVPSTSPSKVPSHVPQTPAPNPEPVPSNTWPPLAWLRCYLCRQPARLNDLYDGMRCPECPSKGDREWRPYMQCPICHTVRSERRGNCQRVMCRARFM